MLIISCYERKVTFKCKTNRKIFKNNYYNYLGELGECKTVEDLKKMIDKYKMFDKTGEVLNINSELE